MCLRLAPRPLIEVPPAIMIILSLCPQTMATISKSGTVNVGAAAGHASSLGPMGSLVGPGGNKVSVLKAAYLNQYKSKFTHASTSSLSSTSSLAPSNQAPPPGNQASSDLPPPAKKKRKSRWD